MLIFKKDMYTLIIIKNIRLIQIYEAIKEF